MMKAFNRNLPGDIAKLTAVSLLLLSGSVLAESHSEEQPKADWSGDLTVSWDKAGGGSGDSSSYDIKLELFHNKDFAEGNKFRHRLMADYAYADSEDADTGDTVKSQDDYRYQYGLHYHVDEESHIEVEADYYTNKPGGMDSNRRLNLQYVYYAHQSEGHSLNITLGVSKADIELTDGTENDITSTTIGLDLTSQLTDKLSFTQHLESHENSDHTDRRSNSSLSFALSDSSSISLSHEIVFHSNTPEGVDRTTTDTSLNLTFSLL